MQTSTDFEYAQLKKKYEKFKTRLDKQMKLGEFYRFSREKQQMLLRRIRRIFRQLMNLKAGLRYAAFASLLSLGFSEAEAQPTYTELSTASPNYALHGIYSVSYNSDPSFFDMDGDGDLDAYIGGFYGIQPFNNTAPTSASIPAFAGTSGYVPTQSPGSHSSSFADIDDDGDFDCVYGNGDTLRYVENTGGTSFPGWASQASFPVSQALGSGMDSLLAGEFVDIDGDNDIDLFWCDNNDCYLSYNTSTVLTAPSFAPGIADPMGIPNTPDANWHPAFVDYDGDGDMDMFLGYNMNTASGAIKYFEYTGAWPTGGFVERTGTANPLSSVSVSKPTWATVTNYPNPAPTFADLDDDGDMDMILGQADGNLRYFEAVIPPREVNLSASTASASEEDGTIVYVTATASGNVTGAQTVDVTVSGTGITGTDYSMGGTITIPDGTDNGILAFTVQDDALEEGPETAKIQISNPTSGITLGSTDSVMVDIEDNEATITFTASATSGTETDETVITLTAHASQTVRGSESVDINVGGTGLSASDYILSSPTFSFADGDDSTQVTLTIADDSDDEAMIENGVIYIDNPTTDLTIGAADSSALDITDNDATLDMTLSANSGSEDAQTAITITATTDEPVEGDQTMDVTVTGTGVTAGDYTLGSASLTILDGDSTATTTFTVVDDAVTEGTETANIEFTNLSARLDAGSADDDVVIADNDVFVTVSLLNANASEASTTTVFVKAETNVPVVGSQTVNFTVTGTGITAGDYTSSNMTITIPNGSDLGIRSFTIVDDAVPEGPESGMVTLTNPSAGITLGTPHAQPFTIADNDGNVVNLSASATTGTEDAQTVITLTANTIIPVASASTVDVTVSGTGITAGDYTLSNATITIPGGASSGSVTFTVVDDAVVEGDETATVTLTNPSAGIVVGSNGSQNIDIEDNELGEVQLSVSTNSGSESGTTAVTLTATSSVAVSGAQTVDVTVSGTGITAGDYTLSSAQITIPDGATTGTATFTVVDDNDIEGPETAVVTISNPSGGITLGATTSQNISITDNDLTSVDLSVSSNNGSEAATSTINLIATTTAPVSGAQTVDVAVSGTGITVGDYTLSGTQIIIPDGMTTGQVNFVVVDDADVEGTETAVITISNPSSGMVLGGNTSENISILDNELISLELSVSTNTASEAAATVVTIDVTAALPVSGAQTVDLAITGDVNGADYTLGSTTLTIPNGGTTASTTFTVVDDAAMEPTETATISLTNYSAGVTAGLNTTEDVDITDNDVATVDLSVSANSGSETAMTAITLTATSNIVVNGDQTVEVDVTGTGITSGDYTLTDTIITIPNGSTTGTVTFTVVDDVVGEGPETATVSISNPSSSLVLGSNISEDITIADNEPTPVNISVSATSGSEYAGTVIDITATSTLAVSGTQTIDVSVSGTGITAGDYTLGSSGTITINDLMTSGTITFTVDDDTLTEGIEVATVSLTNPSAGISIGTTSTADITIYDDESASVVTFTASVDTGYEADTTVVELMLSADAPVYANQTVSISVAGNFVTSGDYTLSDTVIRILQDDTVGITTFTVVNDVLDEGTERAWVYIGDPTEGIIIGGDTSTMIVLIDNDFVDITELDDLSSLRVYPNPMRSSLQVDLSSIDEEVKLELMDVTGRIAYSELVTPGIAGQIHSINTSGYAKGTYLLKVQVGKQVKALRLVKE